MKKPQTKPVNLNNFDARRAAALEGLYIRREAEKKAAAAAAAKQAEDNQTQVVEQLVNAAQGGST